MSNIKWCKIALYFLVSSEVRLREHSNAMWPKEQPGPETEWASKIRQMRLDRAQVLSSLRGTRNANNGQTSSISLLTGKYYKTIEEN